MLDSDVYRSLVVVVVKSIGTTALKSARRAKPKTVLSPTLSNHHTPGSASSPIPQSISFLPAMSAARAFSTALRAGAPRAPIAARVAGTRSYAAAAPTSSGNKPPVALFGVDGTYASALVRFPGAQLAVERRQRMGWACNGWD
jgi:hypothetical protein